MRSVTCGKGELNSRRESAYKRLEAHLRDHRGHHSDLSDDQFKSHAKAQESECKALAGKISGNTSES